MRTETLFKKDNKITVSVKENSFTVKLPFSFKHLLKDFSSKFLSYTYVWNKKARRKLTTLDKSFFVKRDHLDYVTYTFTKEVLMDFTIYLKFRGINILDKDEFEIVVPTRKIPRDIDIKLKSHYKLREDQQKYQDAIINNNMPKALIEARPGAGKTIMSLSIAAAKKKRIMLLLPGYVDKWKMDVLRTLDIEEKDVYVIQGKDSILKLIEKIRNKEEINYKVYVVSEASLMPYAEKDRVKYGKKYIELSDIIDYLEIGTILIDEIHEKFYQSFYLLLLINTQLLIGMTATYTSGNSYVRKFQDILFPSKTRLNFIKIKKYTNTFAIDYELDNPKSAKYLQQNMYNHDTYETNTLIANRSKLLNFIDMLEYYFETAYLQNYKEGFKIVIFVASVRFATMLARYFQDKYRQFDVRRYTSDDPFENILEPDVIISTLQSAGTAIDIPKLKVVFNTVVSVSEIRNKQSHGRLRELEDEEVLYYYFYSTSIPKHSSFHKTRAEQLKPYSKEFKFIRYSKKI